VCACVPHQVPGEVRRPRHQDVSTVPDSHQLLLPLWVDDGWMDVVNGRMDECMNEWLRVINPWCPCAARRTIAVDKPVIGVTRQQRACTPTTTRLVWNVHRHTCSGKHSKVTPKDCSNSGSTAVSGTRLRSWGIWCVERVIFPWLFV